MHTVTPNMFVRLSFDEGARSIGLVVDYAENREQDGQTFVRVDWTPDALGHHNIMNLPTSILTPVCAWNDGITEPDGTHIEVPCRFDAPALFTWRDEYGDQTEAFCLDHALCAGLDVARRGLTFNVERVDSDGVVEPS